MQKLFSSCSKIIRTWFRAGNLSHIAKHPFWKYLVVVCIFSFWLVDNFFIWMLTFFISIIIPTFYFSCSQVVSWSGHRVVINFKKAFYFFRTTFTFILVWLSPFNIFIWSALSRGFQWDYVRWWLLSVMNRSVLYRHEGRQSIIIVWRKGVKEEQYL